MERGRSRPPPSPLFAAAAPCGPVGWQPPADVYRIAHGWLVKVDLAGVRAEDVELQVRGRSLTIRGARRDWSIAECQHSYSMEISYSRFERSIDLPVDVEGARLSTDYRDGMLLVRLLTEAPGDE
jgi:HSP20 family protein